MRQETFTVASNRPLAENIYELLLEGDTSAITAPGQFVNIRLDGFFLRRPISVCDWTENRLTLIYKPLGRGTAELTGYPPGKKLDILTGLGNGFDLSRAGDSPLLIGGGVGIPPLYGLGRRLAEQGRKPRALLGFNSRREVFLEDRFQALGIPVTICTADGTAGLHGLVTEGLASNDGSYLYACGPEAMLRAVYEASGCDGQFSFEERMGCGFGACMGCTHETKNGPVRICREGPVLEREAILWRT